EKIRRTPANAGVLFCAHDQLDSRIGRSRVVPTRDGAKLRALQFELQKTHATASRLGSTRPGSGPRANGAQRRSTRNSSGSIGSSFIPFVDTICRVTSSTASTDMFGIASVTVCGCFIRFIIGTRYPDS